MNGQSEEARAVSVEVERVVSAARDALTDEMVTRLASTAGDAIELMDQVNRAGLARAIPALAQMVNNGDLERLSHLARLYASAQDALTDEMVGRLSEAVGDGLALLDRVNRAGLDRAIPAIAEMVNNGDLNRLVKLARVYSSAEDAMTDEMVSRLIDTIGAGLSLLDRVNRGGGERIVGMLERLESTGGLEKLASTLPQLVDRLEMVRSLLQCMEDAAVASHKAPRAGGGVGGLWRIVKDPDAQDTLQFLMLLGKQLRTSCRSGT